MIEEKQKPNCFGDYGDNCYCSDKEECLIETLKKDIETQNFKEKIQKLRRNW